MMLSLPQQISKLIVCCMTLIYFKLFLTPFPHDFFNELYSIILGVRREDFKPNTHIQVYKLKVLLSFCI
jgi:hypothetical protein